MTITMMIFASELTANDVGSLETIAESPNPDYSNPTVTYGYDDNGSLTSESVAGGDTTTYVYNLQNRLRQLKVNGVGTVNYHYSPDGIRVSKENIGDITTTYLIDP